MNALQRIKIRLYAKALAIIEKDLEKIRETAQHDLNNVPNVWLTSRYQDTLLQIHYGIKEAFYSAEAAASHLKAAVQHFRDVNFYKNLLR